MGTGKSGQQRNDKIEVIKVLVIAVLSFVVGFALVILFLRPTAPSSAQTQPDEETEVPTESTGDETPASADEQEAANKTDSLSETGGGYAPEPEAEQAGDETGDEAGDEGAASSEGEAPSEVPPGRTPEGITLDGDAFYLKCWDASGEELPGSACDRLEVLEKRFSTRLYVVDKCRQKSAGDKAQGKLSLGVEVDFDKMSLSYWNGASSEIEGAGKIATCLRTELAGLPIHGFDHKYERYRIFFTVLFGKGDAKAAKKEAESKKPAGKGKMAEVTMDRVRVRKEPVDGEVIGKISTGNQVKLLERKGGWCKIITPNGNEGWMTCEALKE